MQWQFLMIAHSFIGGYRMVLARKIGLEKKDASLYTLIVSFACVWTIGLLVVLIKQEPLEINKAAQNIQFIIAGGFLFGLANLLTLRLFRLVSASVAVILTLLNNLAVVLIATLFGGESLSIQQMIGILLVIGAISSVEVIAFRLKKKQKNKAQLTVLKSLFVTIVLSLVFALGVVNEKHLLQEMSLSTYLFFGWGAQFIAALVIFLVLGGMSKVRGFNKTTNVNVWLSGLLLAVSGLLFVISLDASNSSSQATVASSFKVIIAMVLAYIFLKERDNTALKIFSTMLSVVGLALLLG